MFFSISFAFWAILSFQILFAPTVRGFSGFYVDNGLGQTVMEESIPEDSTELMRHHILQLLELPDRPDSERFQSIIKWVHIFKSYYLNSQNHNKRNGNACFERLTLITLMTASFFGIKVLFTLQNIIKKVKSIASIVILRISTPEKNIDNEFKLVASLTEKKKWKISLPLNHYALYRIDRHHNKIIHIIIYIKNHFQSIRLF